MAPIYKGQCANRQLFNRGSLRKEESLYKNMVNLHIDLYMYMGSIESRKKKNPKNKTEKMGS